MTTKTQPKTSKASRVRKAAPAAVEPQQQVAATIERVQSKRAQTGKIARILQLLRHEDGATVGKLMEATGWQAHSIRGAMSGAIKRLGYTVSSTKGDGERVYRAEPIQ